MRTLNGEVLIDDNGNFNEQVWINNLIALAELMKVNKNSDDSKGEDEGVSK